MNRIDTETFEMLERDWVNYVSKCESREEIPWQAEGVMAKMQIYCGDLPQGGNHKPDMMPSTIDKFRKIYITEDENFAARMIFRVPVNLQKYIMLEPIIRRKESNADCYRGVMRLHTRSVQKGEDKSQAVLGVSCRYK